MTNAIKTTTADRAIARSISHTEIVTLDYDATADVDLAAACEDSVVCQSHTEYWGTDDDGQEWRVHMRHRAEPEIEG